MVIKFDPIQFDSWQFRLSISKTAEENPNKCLRPFIRPFKINTTFTSSILAVGVQVSNAKEYWQDGGEIIQTYDFLNGDNLYFDKNVSFFAPQKLLINRVTILRLPLTTNVYSIVYFPNVYFESIVLEIWEYTGQIIDISQKQRVEILEALVLSVNTLSEKLDKVEQDIIEIENLLTASPAPQPEEPPPDNNNEENPPQPEEPPPENQELTIETNQEFFTVINGILWLLS